MSVPGKAIKASRRTSPVTSPVAACMHREAVRMVQLNVWKTPRRSSLPQPREARPEDRRRAGEPCKPAENAAGQSDGAVSHDGRQHGSPAGGG